MNQFSLYLALGVVLILVIGVLSFLAGRILGGGNAQSRFSIANEPKTTAPLEPQLPQCSSSAFLGQELFFGPTPETPLISVSRMESPALGSRGRDVHPTAIDAKRLNALAQILHVVLEGMSRHGGTWMRVVVNGQLESGGEGLLLPFVRDNHGRIKELARLDPGSVSAVANAAAFWQIASVIVAQKQLADISAKLSAILSTLDEIKAYLEAERKAKITGSLDYLKQLVACVKAGEIPGSATQQIENIELELVSIQDHILDDYCRLIEDVDLYQDSEWFGSEEMFNKLGGSVSKLKKLNEVWALCGNVRILNVQLLSALPSSRVVLRERLRSIRAKCNALYGNGGIKERVKAAIGPKVEKIESMFNWQTTIDTRRTEVRQRLSKVMNFYEDHRRDCDSQLSNLETDRHRRPVELEAKVEHGKIVALKQRPD